MFTIFMVGKKEVLLLAVIHVNCQLL